MYMSYQLVEKATIQELNSAVSELLRAKWQISGSPFVCAAPPVPNSVTKREPSLMYYQALVK